jgi:hypothetical protein
MARQGSRSKRVFEASFCIGLVVAGCTSTAPPGFIGSRSQGHTVAQMHRDGAACRNQARAIAGVNQTVWFRDAYIDCMASHGYALED